MPSWLNETSQLLPSAAEVQPWFDAVCELWDDGRRTREPAVSRATADRW